MNTDNIKFVSRQEGLALASKGVKTAYDASIYAKGDTNTLSPFFAHKEACIPVPGQLRLYSKTVEGIWQGLKVINGNSDFHYFDRTYIQKRKHIAGRTLSGWLYDGELLDVVTARRVIYRPAYEYQWTKLVSPQLKTEFERMWLQGHTLYFFDFGSNDNPKVAEKSLCHSALIVQFLKQELARKYKLPVPEPIF